MAETNISLTEGKGLTEPVNKLIEAIRAGIGVMFEPAHIRRMAKAEAEAALIKLQNAAETAEKTAQAKATVAILDAQNAAQVSMINAQADSAAALIKAQSSFEIAEKAAQAEAAAAAIKAEMAVQIAEKTAQVEVAAEISKAQVKTEIEAIEDRAKERIRKRELRRQKNIEAIVQKAILQLPAQVNDKKPDEDWIASFFDQCQAVQNEEMQTLWAKLLAGEVARPGTFSLRTLALVKMIRKEEADIFTRFCTCVWVREDKEPLAILFGGREGLFVGRPAITKIGCSFEELVHLQSLGLIFSAPTDLEIVRSLAADVETPSVFGGVPFDPDSPPDVLSYYGRRYKWIRRRDAFPLGDVILTAIGKELAPIAGGQPNEDYRNEIVRKLYLEDLTSQRG
jgi:uncharacterized repeat protein (TIGR03899 family)